MTTTPVPLEVLFPFFAHAPSGFPLETNSSIYHQCCSSEDHFFDKHLDESLCLKKVVILHDFTTRLQDISKIAMEEMVSRNLLSQERSWQVQSTGEIFPIGLRGVSDVEDWRPTLNCKRDVMDLPDLLAHSRMRVEVIHSKKPDGTIEFKKLDCKSVTPEQQNLISGLASHTPVLINWQLFSPSEIANDVVRKAKTHTKFPWEAGNTFGNPHSPGPGPSRLPDGPNLPWTTEWITPRRRSSRLQTKSTTAPSGGRQIAQSIAKDTSIIRTLKNVSRWEGINKTPNHFIQRTWVQSVIWDTTFFVLHNGNTERICLRNRTTQTLFMSDLIEVKDNVLYTRIQHGLYVAALQDAICRVPLVRRHKDEAKETVEQDTVSTGSKRARDEDPLDNPKKRQKRIDTNSDPYSRYNTLLLSVHHSVYSSPHPLMLFRLSDESLCHQKKVYHLSECISLTIHRSLGSGATGVVHSATLSLYGQESIQVVAKLALTPERQKELERELPIYTRLIARNVSSVPKFYGLFRDEGQTVAALVMEDVGSTLSNTRQFEALHRLALCIVPSPIRKIY